VRSAWRTLVLLALASLAALGCTDYVGDDLRAGEYPRDADLRFDEAIGATTAPPTPPTPTRPLDLAPGTCFDDLADPPLAAFPAGREVGVVPCGQPHRYEVYATVSVAEAPDEAWPGHATVDERADLACLAAFEPFVGTDWASSSFDYLHVAPDEPQWAAGGREGRCAVFDLGLVDVTGSVADSGR
jgi:hypothetical protein